jgi:hypothetical protein
MSDAEFWAKFDTPLDQEPTFPVQLPGGCQRAPELSNQRGFINQLRWQAPHICVYANANAGKRNPRQARLEGIRAGVFDVMVIESASKWAMIEFKGFDKSGRAGRLSWQQIEFGNDMCARGVPVGCFYSPEMAIDFLLMHDFSLRGAK